ncbi:unnamed protein product, partial [Brenthis ino]
MAHRNVYQKLGFRISEEVQLLAEEKWIVEALAQIKNQRNCLQIERLHLESLKSKLKTSQSKNVPETNLNIQEDSVASTSAVNIMQTVSTGKANDKEMKINEEFCNEEELNLMVSTPAFMKSNNNDDFNMEEDEEESDDDMFIDMNMLMNGTAK